jgi:uncharacterized protein with von Willebrand factor type A (vWA) domain
LITGIGAGSFDPDSAPKGLCEITTVSGYMTAKNSRELLGGIIHTYQKYDPVEFPSPTAEAPDLVSPAFEHFLMYGNMRELTEEELARAVHLDPSQIKGFGPSLEALIELLRERKRRILETYETDTVQNEARVNYENQARDAKAPSKLARRFQQAVREGQLQDLETLWYASGDEHSPFARDLMRLMERLGEKYQVEELAAKYEFTGRTSMTVPEALEIKRELEKIDELLKQLEEAAKTGQIGVIDMEALAEFAEPGDIHQLSALQQQIQDILREMAERQGLEQGKRGGFQMTPKAYRLFQSKLLSRIFSEIVESRSGRHLGPVVGEGATEMQRTKPYEFGDSVTHMDIPASMVNALLRDGPGLPVRMKPEDIEIHCTRNTPKCATAVLLDMSGSMRYGGLYFNVKRMGLALDGLIRSEYPGDFLQFIEMYTFAKPRHASEIASLMPKPVTIFNPWVRLKADMSDPNTSEFRIPPHFTNIQHGLHLARRFLTAQDTPNRQIVLITDGLPTAHFEGQILYMLYPPDPRTEAATLAEAMHCAREGITINIFLLSSWNQSEDDVRFAYRLAESTKGRVFFVAGRELDRYVVWDYIARRREIIA